MFDVSYHLSNGLGIEEKTREDFVRKALQAALSAAILIVGGAGGAVAQDKIVLKYATFVPANHVLAVNRTAPFMEEVKRLSNGRVDFEYYPNEQAGKARSFIDLLNTGAVDIAEIGIGYFSATTLPLLGIIEFPGLTDSSCQTSAALRSIGMPGGPLHEADFKENGIRALDFMVNPPFQIAPSRVPITSVAQVTGKKLRTAGGVMELAVKGLGGIPVSITASEIYTALDRGTLDGVMFTWILADTYDFPKIAKYGTYGFGFGTPGQFVMIGENTFQKLPKDVQDILVQAGATVEKQICKYLDDNETKMVEKYKTAGQNIHFWNAQEKEQMLKATKDLPKLWMDTLEARGKPAKAVWDGFNASLGKKTQ